MADQATALLADELASLNQLADALTQEHGALLGNDTEALDAALAHKNACLLQQQTVTSAREALLPGNLTDHALNPSQQELVDQLHTLSEQCRHVNVSNGALIARKQQLMRTTLDVLRQQDPVPATYSDNGDTQEDHSSRSLGSV